ncbi:amino acid ABC transporter permease [Corynebacterium sp. 320]|uniref:Amino acid ABC transporter permease n=1 Tax=Corynebacterium zhongnanshanii TaxID=2768834 RepID=A0ABQ6VIW3_9CORY|nr:MULTISPECIES: amino acid ABC transporter permease [Corynebacterium]KAB1502435.1 amino acid ABC transporter permease [Corynebacterium sp. 320]KAB1551344.1 amino acid ABC transporter permease [Corynebacterium sp. 321]KAB1551827.1 amino acid ABC transporter permease [Corynebacterium sp. 319]KAB3520884.1 amino acid ABC transporter permease [Corynebacterium zhongnanshanii]KAB3526042.1 amino acid ABC transporter permease [Corynebacterium sp. 250]
MNPELWSEMKPELLPAFWVTIKLTFYSAVGSMIVGTILTAMRVSPVGILRTLSAWYINIVRNTPLTLIILLASMGLYYNLGLLLAVENDTFIEKQNFRLAVLAFVAYTSCFVAESLRSGINTVPFGQAEAARSLGLSFSQNFRHVIFPQALRGAIVPLGNTLIALTKNTTIASVIGVAEASLLMKALTEDYASDILVIFGVIAVGFIILTLPTGLFFGWAGKRWAVKR